MYIYIGRLWLAQELLICMTYVNLAQHSVSLQSIFQYLEITKRTITAVDVVFLLVFDQRIHSYSLQLIFSEFTAYFFFVQTKEHTRFVIYLFFCLFVNQFI